eukprot:snap_masked-scaffold_13-processed-gene-9.35-mRNA-1 protein AED:1.00 eAED:1.00 QI:0/0/0/0/1/1/3/0/97
MNCNFSAHFLLTGIFIVSIEYCLDKRDGMGYEAAIVHEFNLLIHTRKREGVLLRYSKDNAIVRNTWELGAYMHSVFWIELDRLPKYQEIGVLFLELK